MTVQGLLLDLEGVLYQDDRPLAGAIEALARMRGDGLRVRYLTNTTTRPRSAIVARMAGMGFAVEADEVFTPPAAAALLLERDGLTRLHLAAPAALAEDFSGFVLTDEAPDAVVMGDLYREFDWNRLNGIFAMLRAGARLIALHKNRYCRRDDDLALDLGPFVAAVEYAADVRADIAGKPSANFFDMALASLGLAADAVVMVGDDIEADIGGAQHAGLGAVQVRTGKYSPADESHPTVTPDACVDSIADLPDLIAKM